MEAIDPKQRPVQSLDWGALKWFVTPTTPRRRPHLW